MDIILSPCLFNCYYIFTKFVILMRKCAKRNKKFPYAFAKIEKTLWKEMSKICLFSNM